MLVVHHLEHSRSQRILWLLHELGMPHEVRHYKRGRMLAAPAELKRIHPLGKSPIIEDEGRAIAETGAIIEYIVEKAGGQLGAPADRDEALRYRYYMHYAEGSVMTALLMKLVLGLIPVLGKVAQKAFQPMITAHLDFIESELAQRPWFAGASFTAADVMMSFPLEFGAARSKGLVGRPHSAAWLERIHARPAYKAALAEGGPYMFG